MADPSLDPSHKPQISGSREREPGYRTNPLVSQTFKGTQVPETAALNMVYGVPGQAEAADLLRMPGADKDIKGINLNGRDSTANPAVAVLQEPIPGVDYPNGVAGNGQVYIESQQKIGFDRIPVEGEADQNPVQAGSREANGSLKLPDLTQPESSADSSVANALKIAFEEYGLATRETGRNEIPVQPPAPSTTVYAATKKLGEIKPQAAAPDSEKEPLNGTPLLNTDQSSGIIIPPPPGDTTADFQKDDDFEKRRAAFFGNALDQLNPDLAKVIRTAYRPDITFEPPDLETAKETLNHLSEQLTGHKMAINLVSGEMYALFGTQHALMLQALHILQELGMLKVNQLRPELSVQVNPQLTVCSIGGIESGLFKLWGAAQAEAIDPNLAFLNSETKTKLQTKVRLIPELLSEELTNKHAKSLDLLLAFDVFSHGAGTVPDPSSVEDYLPLLLDCFTLLKPNQYALMTGDRLAYLLVQHPELLAQVDLEDIIPIFRNSENFHSDQNLFVFRRRPEPNQQDRSDDMGTTDAMISKTEAATIIPAPRTFVYNPKDETGESRKEFDQFMPKLRADGPVLWIHFDQIRKSVHDLYGTDMDLTFEHILTACYLALQEDRMMRDDFEAVPVLSIRSMHERIRSQHGRSVEILDWQQFLNGPDAEQQVSIVHGFRGYQAILGQWSELYKRNITFGLAMECTSPEDLVLAEQLTAAFTEEIDGEPFIDPDRMAILKPQESTTATSFPFPEIFTLQALALSTFQNKNLLNLRPDQIESILTLIQNQYPDEKPAWVTQLTTALTKLQIHHNPNKSEMPVLANTTEAIDWVFHYEATQADTSQPGGLTTDAESGQPSEADVIPSAGEGGHFDDGGPGKIVDLRTPEEGDPDESNPTPPAPESSPDAELIHQLISSGDIPGMLTTVTQTYGRNFEAKRQYLKLLQVSYPQLRLHPYFTDSYWLARTQPDFKTSDPSSQRDRRPIGTGEGKAEFFKKSRFLTGPAGSVVLSEALATALHVFMTREVEIEGEKKRVHRQAHDLVYTLELGGPELAEVKVKLLNDALERIGSDTRLIPVQMLAGLPPSAYSFGVNTLSQTPENIDKLRRLRPPEEIDPLRQRVVSFDQDRQLLDIDRTPSETTYLWISWQNRWYEITRQQGDDPSTWQTISGRYREDIKLHFGQARVLTALMGQSSEGNYLASSLMELVLATGYQAKTIKKYLTEILAQVPPESDAFAVIQARCQQLAVTVKQSGPVPSRPVKESQTTLVGPDHFTKLVQPKPLSPAQFFERTTVEAEVGQLLTAEDGQVSWEQIIQLAEVLGARFGNTTNKILRQTAQTLLAETSQNKNKVADETTVEQHYFNDILDPDSAFAGVVISQEQLVETSRGLSLRRVSKIILPYSGGVLMITTPDTLASQDIQLRLQDLIIQVVETSDARLSDALRTVLGLSEGTLSRFPQAFVVRGLAGLETIQLRSESQESYGRLPLPKEVDLNELRAVYQTTGKILEGSAPIVPSAPIQTTLVRIPKRGLPGARRMISAFPTEKTPDPLDHLVKQYQSRINTEFPSNSPERARTLQNVLNHLVLWGDDQYRVEAQGSGGFHLIDPTTGVACKVTATQLLALYLDQQLTVIATGPTDQPVTVQDKSRKDQERPPSQSRLTETTFSEERTQQRLRLQALHDLYRLLPSYDSPDTREKIGEYLDRVLPTFQIQQGEQWYSLTSYDSKTQTVNLTGLETEIQISLKDFCYALQFDTKLIHLNFPEDYSISDVMEFLTPQMLWNLGPEGRRKLADQLDGWDMVVTRGSKEHRWNLSREASSTTGSVEYRIAPSQGGGQRLNAFNFLSEIIKGRDQGIFKSLTPAPLDSPTFDYPQLSRQRVEGLTPDDAQSLINKLIEDKIVLRVQLPRQQPFQGLLSKVDDEYRITELRSGSGKPKVNSFKNAHLFLGKHLLNSEDTAFQLPRGLIPAADRLWLVQLTDSELAALNDAAIRQRLEELTGVPIVLENEVRTITKSADGKFAVARLYSDRNLGSYSDSLAMPIPEALADQRRLLQQIRDSAFLPQSHPLYEQLNEIHPGDLEAQQIFVKEQLLGRYLASPLIHHGTPFIVAALTSTTGSDGQSYPQVQLTTPYNQTVTVNLKGLLNYVESGNTRILNPVAGLHHTQVCVQELGSKTLQALPSELRSLLVQQLAGIVGYISDQAHYLDQQANGYLEPLPLTIPASQKSQAPLIALDNLRAGRLRPDWRSVLAADRFRHNPELETTIQANLGHFFLSPGQSALLHVRPYGKERILTQLRVDSHPEFRLPPIAATLAQEIGLLIKAEGPAVDQWLAATPTETAQAQLGQWQGYRFQTKSSDLQIVSLTDQTVLIMRQPHDGANPDFIPFTYRDFFGYLAGHPFEAVTRSSISTAAALLQAQGLTPATQLQLPVPSEPEPATIFEQLRHLGIPDPYQFAKSLQLAIQKTHNLLIQRDSTSEDRPLLATISTSAVITSVPPTATGRYSSGALVGFYEDFSVALKEINQQANRGPYNPDYPYLLVQIEISESQVSAHLVANTGNRTHWQYLQQIPASETLPEEWRQPLPTADLVTETRSQTPLQVFTHNSAQILAKHPKAQPGTIFYTQDNYPLSSGETKALGLLAAEVQADDPRWILLVSPRPLPSSTTTSTYANPGDLHVLLAASAQASIGLMKRLQTVLPVLPDTEMVYIVAERLPNGTVVLHHHSASLMAVEALEAWEARLDGESIQLSGLPQLRFTQGTNLSQKGVLTNPETGQVKELVLNLAVVLDALLQAPGQTQSASALIQAINAKRQALGGQPYQTNPDIDPMVTVLNQVLEEMQFDPIWRITPLEVVNRKASAFRLGPPPSDPPKPPTPDRSPDPERKVIPVNPGKISTTLQLALPILQRLDLDFYQALQSQPQLPIEQDPAVWDTWWKLTLKSDRVLRALSQLKTPPPARESLAYLLKHLEPWLGAIPIEQLEHHSEFLHELRVACALIVPGSSLAGHSNLARYAIAYPQIQSAGQLEAEFRENLEFDDTFSWKATLDVVAARMGFTDLPRSLTIILESGYWSPTLVARLHQAALLTPETRDVTSLLSANLTPQSLGQLKSKITASLTAMLGWDPKEAQPGKLEVIENKAESFEAFIENVLTYALASYQANDPAQSKISWAQHVEVTLAELIPANIQVPVLRAFLAGDQTRPGFLELVAEYNGKLDQVPVSNQSPIGDPPLHSGELNSEITLSRLQAAGIINPKKVLELVRRVVSDHQTIQQPVFCVIQATNDINLGTTQVGHIQTNLLDSVVGLFDTAAVKNSSDDIDSYLVRIDPRTQRFKILYRLSVPSDREELNALRKGDIAQPRRDFDAIPSFSTSETTTAQPPQAAGSPKKEQATTSPNLKAIRDQHREVVLTLTTDAELTAFLQTHYPQYALDGERPFEVVDRHHKTPLNYKVWCKSPYNQKPATFTIKHILGAAYVTAKRQQEAAVERQKAVTTLSKPAVATAWQTLLTAVPSTSPLQDHLPQADWTSYSNQELKEVASYSTGFWDFQIGTGYGHIKGSLQHCLAAPNPNNVLSLLNRSLRLTMTFADQPNRLAKIQQALKLLLGSTSLEAYNQVITQADALFKEAMEGGAPNEASTTSAGAQTVACLPETSQVEAVQSPLLAGYSPESTKEGEEAITGFDSIPPTWVQAALEELADDESLLTKDILPPTDMSLTHTTDRESRLIRTVLSEYVLKMFPTPNITLVGIGAKRRAVNNQDILNPLTPTLITAYLTHRQTPHRIKAMDINPRVVETAQQQHWLVLPDQWQTLPEYQVLVGVARVQPEQFEQLPPNIELYHDYLSRDKKNRAVWVLRLPEFNSIQYEIKDVCRALLPKEVGTEHLISAIHMLFQLSKPEQQVALWNMTQRLVEGGYLLLDSSAQLLFKKYDGWLDQKHLDDLGLELILEVDDTTWLLRKKTESPNRPPPQPGELMAQAIETQQWDVFKEYFIAVIQQSKEQMEANATNALTKADREHKLAQAIFSLNSFVEKLPHDCTSDCIKAAAEVYEIPLPHTFSRIYGETTKFDPTLEEVLKAVGLEFQPTRLQTLVNHFKAQGLTVTSTASNVPLVQGSTSSTLSPNAPVYFGSSPEYLAALRTKTKRVFLDLPSLSTSPFILDLNSEHGALDQVIASEYLDKIIIGCNVEPDSESHGDNLLFLQAPVIEALEGLNKNPGFEPASLVIITSPGTSNLGLNETNISLLEDVLADDGVIWIEGYETLTKQPWFLEHFEYVSYSTAEPKATSDTKESDIQFWRKRKRTSTGSTTDHIDAEDLGIRYAATAEATPTPELLHGYPLYTQPEDVKSEHTSSVEWLNQESLEKRQLKAGEIFNSKQWELIEPHLPENQKGVVVVGGPGFILEEILNPLKADHSVIVLERSREKIEYLAQSLAEKNIDPSRVRFYLGDFYTLAQSFPELATGNLVVTAKHIRINPNDPNLEEEKQLAESFLSYMQPGTTAWVDEAGEDFRATLAPFVEFLDQTTSTTTFRCTAKPAKETKSEAREERILGVDKNDLTPPSPRIESEAGSERSEHTINSEPRLYLKHLLTLPTVPHWLKEAASAALTELDQPHPNYIPIVTETNINRGEVEQDIYTNYLLPTLQENQPLNLCTVGLGEPESSSDTSFSILSRFYSWVEALGHPAFVTGIDMLDLVLQRHETLTATNDHITLIKGNAAFMNLSSQGPFNGISMGSVLYQNPTEHQMLMLYNAAKALAEGGILVVDSYDPKHRKFATFPLDPTHDGWLTPEKLNDLGLEEVERQTDPLYPNQIVLVLRKQKTTPDGVVRVKEERVPSDLISNRIVQSDLLSSQGPELDGRKAGESNSIPEGTPDLSDQSSRQATLPSTTLIVSNSPDSDQVIKDNPSHSALVPINSVDRSPQKETQLTTADKLLTLPTLLEYELEALRYTAQAESVISHADHTFPPKPFNHLKSVNPGVYYIPDDRGSHVISFEYELLGLTQPRTHQKEEEQHSFPLDVIRMQQLPDTPIVVLTASETEMKFFQPGWIQNLNNEGYLAIKKTTNASGQDHYVWLIYKEEDTIQELPVGFSKTQDATAQKGQILIPDLSFEEPHPLLPQIHSHLPEDYVGNSPEQSQTHLTRMSDLFKALDQYLEAHLQSVGQPFSMLEIGVGGRDANVSTCYEPWFLAAYLQEQFQNGQIGKPGLVILDHSLPNLLQLSQQPDIEVPGGYLPLARKLLDWYRTAVGQEAFKDNDTPGSFSVSLNLPPFAHEIIQTIHHAQAEALPDEIGLFNLITALNVFPHLTSEQQQQALRGAVAHLNDGGGIVVNNLVDPEGSFRPFFEQDGGSISLELLKELGLTAHLISTTYRDTFDPELDDDEPNPDPTRRDEVYLLVKQNKEVPVGFSKTETGGTVITERDATPAHSSEKNEPVDPALAQISFETILKQLRPGQPILLIHTKNSSQGMKVIDYPTNQDSFITAAETQTHHNIQLKARQRTQFDTFKRYGLDAGNFDQLVYGGLGIGVGLVALESLMPNVKEIHAVDTIQQVKIADDRLTLHLTLINDLPAILKNTSSWFQGDSSHRLVSLEFLGEYLKSRIGLNENSVHGLAATVGRGYLYLHENLADGRSRQAALVCNQDWFLEIFEELTPPQPAQGWQDPIRPRMFKVRAKYLKQHSIEEGNDLLQVVIPQLLTLKDKRQITGPAFAHISVGDLDHGGTQIHDIAPSLAESLAYLNQERGVAFNHQSEANYHLIVYISEGDQPQIIPLFNTKDPTAQAELKTVLDQIQNGEFDEAAQKGSEPSPTAHKPESSADLGSVLLRAQIPEPYHSTIKNALLSARLARFELAEPPVIEDLPEDQRRAQVRLTANFMGSPIEAVVQTTERNPEAPTESTESTLVVSILIQPQQSGAHALTPVTRIQVFQKTQTGLGVVNDTVTQAQQSETNLKLDVFLVPSDQVSQIQVSELVQTIPPRDLATLLKAASWYRVEQNPDSDSLTCQWVNTSDSDNPRENDSLPIVVTDPDAIVAFTQSSFPVIQTTLGFINDGLNDAQQSSLSDEQLALLRDMDQQCQAALALFSSSQPGTRAAAKGPGSLFRGRTPSTNPVEVPPDKVSSEISFFNSSNRKPYSYGGTQKFEKITYPNPSEYQVNTEVMIAHRPKREDGLILRYQESRFEASVSLGYQCKPEFNKTETRLLPYRASWNTFDLTGNIFIGNRKGITLAQLAVDIDEVGFLEHGLALMAQQNIRTIQLSIDPDTHLADLIQKKPPVTDAQKLLDCLSIPEKYQLIDIHTKRDEWGALTLTILDRDQIPTQPFFPATLSEALTNNLRNHGVSINPLQPPHKTIQPHLGAFMMTIPLNNGVVPNEIKILLAQIIKKPTWQFSIGFFGNNIAKYPDPRNSQMFPVLSQYLDTINTDEVSSAETLIVDLAPANWAWRCDIREIISPPIYSQRVTPSYLTIKHPQYQGTWTHEAQVQFDGNMGAITFNTDPHTLHLGIEAGFPFYSAKPILPIPPSEYDALGLMLALKDNSWLEIMEYINDQRQDLLYTYGIDLLYLLNNHRDQLPSVIEYQNCSFTPDDKVKVHVVPLDQKPHWHQELADTYQVISLDMSQTYVHIQKNLTYYIQSLLETVPEGKPPIIVLEGLELLIHQDQQEQIQNAIYILLDAANRTDVTPPIPPVVLAFGYRDPVDDETRDQDLADKNEGKLPPKAEPLETRESAAQNLSSYPTPNASGGQMEPPPPPFTEATDFADPQKSSRSELIAHLTEPPHRTEYHSTLLNFDSFPEPTWKMNATEKANLRVRFDAEQQFLSWVIQQLEPEQASQPPARQIERFFHWLENRVSTRAAALVLSHYGMTTGTCLSRKQLAHDYSIHEKIIGDDKVHVFQTLVSVFTSALATDPALQTIYPVLAQYYAVDAAALLTLDPNASIPEIPSGSKRSNYLTHKRLAFLADREYIQAYEPEIISWLETLYGNEYAIIAKKFYRLGEYSDSDVYPYQGNIAGDLNRNPLAIQLLQDVQDAVRIIAEFVHGTHDPDYRINERRWTTERTERAIPEAALNTFFYRQEVFYHQLAVFRAVQTAKEIESNLTPAELHLLSHSSWAVLHGEAKQTGLDRFNQESTIQYDLNRVKELEDRLLHELETSRLGLENRTRWLTAVQTQPRLFHDLVEEFKNIVESYYLYKIPQPEIGQEAQTVYVGPLRQVIAYLIDKRVSNTDRDPEQSWIDALKIRTAFTRDQLEFFWNTEDLSNHLQLWLRALIQHPDSLEAAQRTIAQVDPELDLADLTATDPTRFTNALNGLRQIAERLGQKGDRIEIRELLASLPSPHTSDFGLAARSLTPGNPDPRLEYKPVPPPASEVVQTLLLTGSADPQRPLNREHRGLTLNQVLTDAGISASKLTDWVVLAIGRGEELGLLPYLPNLRHLVAAGYPLHPGAWQEYQNNSARNVRLHPIANTLDAFLTSFDPSQLTPAGRRLVTLLNPGRGISGNIGIHEGNVDYLQALVGTGNLIIQGDDLIESQPWFCERFTLRHQTQASSPAQTYRVYESRRESVTQSPNSTN